MEDLTGQALENTVIEVFDGQRLSEVELPCIQCGGEGGDNWGLCEVCWDAHQDANARYGVPGDEAMDWPIQFGPNH